MTTRRSKSVKLEERDGPWGKFITQTIVDWHRSGKLIETEKRWGIQPSAFLKKAREQTP
jgi:polar amino acid transport system substrate-binding protein